MNLTKRQKETLFQAWDYCDREDKSTEFMLQYMSDVANIDYDDVVEWIVGPAEEEREKWYESGGDRKRGGIIAKIQNLFRP